MALRATVVGGRLVMDEQSDLPDGTVLELVVDDEGDDLEEAERRALHDALDVAHAELMQGEGRDGAEILRELRAKR